MIRSKLIIHMFIIYASNICDTATQEKSTYRGILLLDAWDPIY